MAPLGREPSDYHCWQRRSLRGARPCKLQAATSEPAAFRPGGDAVTPNAAANRLAALSPVRLSDGLAGKTAGSVSEMAEKSDNRELREITGCRI